MYKEVPAIQPVVIRRCTAQNVDRRWARFLHRFSDESGKDTVILRHLQLNETGGFP